MGFQQTGARTGVKLASPGYFRVKHASLRALVAMSCGVGDDQVNGAEWMNELFFDIDARAPTETTPVQAQEMLSELLNERFGLVYHSAVAVKPGYALMVGKNGPKISRSAPADSARADQGGRKVAPNSSRSELKGEPGTAAFRMPGVTLEMVADAFSRWLAVPVDDATGLDGKFDVELRFSGHDEGSGKIAAQQLGLVLTRSRTSVKNVFVDAIRKTPTAD